MDDSDALLAELKAAQQERKAAEARVAYLEGVERDVKADQDKVEQLRAQWADWSTYLDQDALLARQVLRKVLASSIVVTPEIVAERLSWRFGGISRFDGVLAGGLTKGSIAVVERKGWDDPALLKALGFEAPLMVHPICGGSDAAIREPGARDIDMAPHTPARLAAPAEPGAPDSPCQAGRMVRDEGVS